MKWKPRHPKLSWWNIIPHKCEVCKKMFWFERFFCILTGPYHGGIGKLKYYCLGCAPEVLTNKDWHPKRPEITPHGQGRQGIRRA
jgi:hypothetical protein